MEHVRFGRTGLKVSRLCLGTMTFGLQSDEETSRAILDYAADSGITFIDTADVYPGGGDLSTIGRTEEILGRWLRGRRDQFVLATKCYRPTGPQAWERGNSRKHILDAVEASLRRLQTDHVDIYQLHAYDEETPLDETLWTLDHLVQSGKVRYVGVSNWVAWRVALALGRSEARGLVRIGCVQPRYNLLFREFERDLLPLCAAEGLAVIPYNPLAGGLLTGKHRSVDAPPLEGSRFLLGTAGARYQKRYWNAASFDTVNRLRAIADDAGIPLPTLALAWVLANPAVTAPIIGASKPEQLAATLAAIYRPLDSDLLTALDELTRPYRMGDAQR